MARQQIAAENHPESRPSVASLNDAYPGVVRLRGVTTVALPTAVTVRRILVSVGDAVVAGQAVVELAEDDARHSSEQRAFDLARAKEDTSRLERSVELSDRSIRSLMVGVADRRAQLAIAQRNADKFPNREWKDSPERAQAAYDQAVARERRVAELAAQGAGALQELEEAQVAVRVAADDLAIAKRSAAARADVDARQVELERAQADLLLAEQARARTDGELVQARLRRTQAESALEATVTRHDDLTVRAQSSGVVAEARAKAGDRVLAGAPLLTLASVDPMVVDVAVPSEIVDILRRGQPARVRLSKTTDESEGRIMTISPLAGDAGAHAVEVELKNPSGALLAGRPARVRFVLNR